MEAKYHTSCLLVGLKKIRRKETESQKQFKHDDTALIITLKNVEAGIKKGKGFSVATIYKQYQSLWGFKSKRTLMDLLKRQFEHRIDIIKPERGQKSSLIVPAMQKAETIQRYIQVSDASTSVNPLSFKGDSELSQIHKICSKIKLQIDNVPHYKENKNLDILNYKKYVPQSLLWLIGLLISDEEDKDEVIILNICQDIIYNRSKERKFTPKHIALNLMIHQEIRSKKIVESLHACGHAISYKDVLRYRNSIAQEE